VLNFAAFVLAARYMSVHDFGIFGGLVAVVGILSKIIDFGLGPIIFRESSKDNSSFDLLNSAITIRLLLFAAVILGFNLVAYFLNYTVQEFVISNTLFVSIILSTRMANFRELLSTPFKVNLKMHYPMTLTILDNVLFLIAVIFMPIFKGGIYYFVFAYVFSTIPGFIVQYIFLYKKFDYKISFNLEKAIWLLKEASPLAGFILLVIVYQQFDIVLLTWMKGEYAAGIYAAATRLSMPLNIIPTIIVTTVFPFLVKNLSDKKRTDEINALVYKVLFLVSFGLAIIISFKSQSIITLVFGDKYLEAAIPTYAIFWSQVFMFFNFFTLDLLTAHSKQFWNLIYSIILVVANTALNLLWIPDYSATGVGFSKLIAGFIGFIFMLYVLGKYNFSLNFINKDFILWTFVIAIVVFLLAYLPLIPYLILSSLMILVSLKYLRYFDNVELSVILRLINGEKWLRLLKR